MCMHVAKPARHPARTRKPAAPVLPEQQQAGRATLPANLPTYFTQSTSPVTVLLFPLPASLSYPIAPDDDDDDLDLPNAVATTAPSSNHTRLTCPSILHHQYYHDQDDDDKNIIPHYTEHPIVHASIRLQYQYQLQSPPLIPQTAFHSTLSTPGTSIHSYTGRFE